MDIKIKRIYESATLADGYRILVDRLWPRGIRKDDARLGAWIKEVGPSTDLRKWFGHDPEKWAQFSKRYEAELKASGALDELFSAIGSHKKVTLLFAAKDEEHNNAVVLQRLLAAFRK